MSSSTDRVKAYRERQRLEVLALRAEVLALKTELNAVTKGARYQRVTNAVTNAGPNDCDDLRTPVTNAVVGILGGVGGSFKKDSLTGLSLISDLEILSPLEPDVSVHTRVAEPMPTMAPTRRLIDPKLSIDEDSRQAALMVGILEVELVWRRFVDRCIATGETAVDFRALFRSRLAFFRNDERRERRKDQAVRAPQQGPDPDDLAVRRKRRLEIEAASRAAQIAEIIAAEEAKGR